MLRITIAVIDYARNVCKIDDANSSEFKPNLKIRLLISWNPKGQLS